MVYPYCPAGTCTDYLRNNAKADKMDIIQQVTDGLIYLHSRPKAIVHGDIKASNILVREDGTPMLADFGLSRVAMETATRWTTSPTPGSYRWMAPKLFGGIENEITVLVTVKSDVWAFGCLCLEASVKDLLFSLITVFTRLQPLLDSNRAYSLGSIQQQHKNR
ncbi:kinase-like protein [Ceratobasidium sp. AG-I]|nr:kinase-like protein [Ceratobasidium sp. AG-I]